jgi:spermidine synthase
LTTSNAPGHRGFALGMSAGWLRKYFSLEDPPSKRILWPLFLVSFTALYIEILLIRWIGTEVRVFAYFQNLALVACFLGFGLGCFQAGRKKGYLFDAVALGLLVALAEVPIPLWKNVLESISSGLAFSSNASLWAHLGEPRQVSELVRFFIVSALFMASFLLLVVATMIPLGRWVGTYLDAAKNPVSAYTSNLAGSLAGIWLFAGLAFLRLSPMIWFGMALALYVLVYDRSKRFRVSGALLLAGSLLLFHLAYSGGTKTYWSPYQKLEVKSLGEQEYTIQVNNTLYMTIANLTPEFLSRHPEMSEEYPRSSYDAPFRFVERRDRVLIVGAGAGNDAAAALRNGAAQVDAVEIDPVIYTLGKSLHPDHPYSSPRVRIILNDARAYLRQTSARYDVIVFGLLDSHTQFSGYSNMRIDNYVYTEEAFREAKRLLKPSGVLVVKFEVGKPWTWMGERFYAMFGHLFGRPPVVFYAPQAGGLLSASVFHASNDPDFWRRAARPDLATLVAANPPPFSPASDPPPMTTDDWPYVYHRSHTIPRAYLTISLILLVMAVALTRRELAPAKISAWNFFFLGAGFLLLETQLVSRLALYFGATWWVNCVALSAILLMLVLANFWVERQKPDRLGPYYIALIASLIAIYVVPWQQLPFGPRSLGTLLAAAYGLPVFFAGVIFTETFRRCEDKSRSFGSNIVGAVAGGLAQNASFVIGLKALLLLAAIFYLFAAVCGGHPRAWFDPRPPTRATS